MTRTNFLGCGNGKYLGVNSEVFMVGSDICPELVSIGQGRGHEVITCDCLHLPYRNNQFDGAICIAVIHHLSSESRRVKAVLEMARVLRVGGKMLIYVWAMEQERKKVNKICLLRDFILTLSVCLSGRDGAMALAAQVQFWFRRC